jgi:hypothetical protein
MVAIIIRRTAVLNPLSKQPKSQAGSFGRPRNCLSVSGMSMRFHMSTSTESAFHRLNKAGPERRALISRSLAKGRERV